MKTFTIAAVLGFTSTAVAACSRSGSLTITFFGYPDNDPASNAVAYNCGGRNCHASGNAKGTYDDPLTMASAKGEFNQCETIYVPYLKKCVRYEDYCQKCTEDYASGKKHIDIYTGNNDSGGGDQIQRERDLTPSPKRQERHHPQPHYQLRG